MIAMWIALLAALLNCLIAAVAYALHEYSSSKLAAQFERRGKGDQIDSFLAMRSELLLVIPLVRMVLNLTIFIGMIAFFAPPDQVNSWGDVTIALLVTGGVVAVFGIAIPISWARYAAEILLIYSLPVLKVLNSILKPVRVILDFIDPLVRRLLGAPKQTNGDRAPVEQEILDAISEGERTGLVNEDQADMIEAVVEFPSITADQIMTPRTDIEGIPIDATLDDVKEFIAEAGHSRVPVYDGDLDHIIGILYVKDLVTFIGTNGDTSFCLRNAVREATFVPESKTVHDLLSQFKSSKIHIALILDEYGGTTGLVTIEDILEEIVGEIHDEHEPFEPDPQITKIESHVYEVDGRVYIDDVNDQLHLQLPEDEDYDTIGGFVFSTLGRIPDVGDEFEFANTRITIVDAEKTKINRVRIEINVAAYSESVDKSDGS